MKNIYFVILALCIMMHIFTSIRKNKLSVKTSFGWIIGAFGMLFLAIFPKSLDWLSNFIGVEYPPALFLTLCVVILFVIDFNNSKKLAEYQTKIIELAQHVTLLEGKNIITKEKKIMLKYILTGIYVLCTTLGIYFMKLGGNSFQIGLNGSFSFKMGYITLLGFLFYIVSFLLWQRLLVTFDLSYIVPITTGISQLIILLIGILAFKEKINATGIVGALLIIVGVVLLALGKR